MLRLLAILAAIAALGAANALAAKPEASPVNPYAADFAVARSETDDPLQLEILADDVITADEYEHVVTAFVGCMADAGYVITLTADPLNPAVPSYTWTPTPGTPMALTDDEQTAYDTAFDTCSTEHKSQVEMLYGSIIANPENRPWPQMYRDCLVRSGVLPQDFTVADFEAAELSGEWPDGVDFWSDDFAVCIGNPANPIELPITYDQPWP